MKSRYGKLILEAGEGINFSVEEVENQTLIIKAMMKKENEKESESVRTNSKNALANYMNPPIPDGFYHLEGNWDTGFVIVRKYDGSQFVWIPVQSLSSINIDEQVSCGTKFGRRNWTGGMDISKTADPRTEEFLMQEESVQKYGGFYISRYNISWRMRIGQVSVRGEKPWIMVSQEDAIKYASYMVDRDDVKSHLPYGAEYDSVLEWFIETKARSMEDIIGDSSYWGNHWKNFLTSDEKVRETGKEEEWCTNAIYDFAGNVSEITQERAVEGDEVVVRGFDVYSKTPSVATRTLVKKDYESDACGFRAALWIK